MGRIVAIAWGITLVLAYTALGDVLGRLIEGHRRDAALFAPAFVTVAALVASLVLTAMWARRGRGAGADPPAGGRRRFLLGAAGAVGGVVASLAAALVPNRSWLTVTVPKIFAVRPPYKAAEPDPAWRGARVSEYRRLGRTDFRISDISIGSGSSTGGRQTADVVREAIDRGVNYFDTAPDYAATGSENRFGEAMQGRRDELFLATKFCMPNGHLPPGSPVQAYLDAVDGSLRRLRTDWVDLVHIHSCDSVERLLDPSAHEAFDRLKQAGKVRFLGVSTHTPNLEAVANAAIESDRFDVMMLAYHYGAWPSIGDIVERAAARDVGVVGMKTLRGSLHEGLLERRDERDSFTQASFKWVLSNPNVSGLVISLWETAQLDEFLTASGKRPSASELALLERYDRAVATRACRPHCGACLDSCPEGLPIHDVLRHRSYFEGFGAEKEAMRLYGQLEVQADVCTGCSAPCANACPYGIPIPERTREAHELLTLA
jgi:predicted aldo/keto reductase-like oxidoreductase